MLTKPEELADSTVVAAAAMRWGLHAVDIEYAPVGFGSYHWWIAADGAPWFVTVDDLETRRRDDSESRDDAFERLSAALSTARLLQDTGMDFVIAPCPSASGDVVIRIDDRFAMAVYPRVEGATYKWGGYETQTERLAVLDLITAVHGAGASHRRHALTDDMAIPCRAGLRRALTDTDEEWSTGPFSQPARQLLELHAGAVALALRRYDRLAALAAGRAGRMVLTHGEPHRGNTITTPSGPVLIDWDTALVAPPERDLWALAAEDGTILDAYTQRTGVAVDEDAIALYSLWWDLTEVSLYVAQFRRPHADNKDTRAAWSALNEHLDGDRW